MKFLVFLVLLILIPASVYATHQNQSTNCSVSINGEILPVTYISQERINPDGSFYAGDGFHYLFTFTGDEECLSFSVLPVESEGIFDVISHELFMWTSPTQKTHTHNDYTMKPKYLTTTHYYIDKIYHCKNDNENCQSLVLAENPSYSVREDHTITGQLKKLLDGLATASTYQIRTEETQDWGFTNMDGSHEHADYLHTSESNESIISFENYVESKCSNLEKYSGCVFGHVELETEMVNQKCMFAELEKMQIKYDIKKDFCVDVNHNLSLSIQGTKLSCNNDECKTVKVEKSQNINPNIIPSEFEIILSDPPVKDRDNYDGKNKDETYYPHDPIGIIHNPSLLWKDSRSETIQFETTKEYDVINEYEYDCFENQCEHKIELSIVYPALYNFGNGQGITIYNSTRDEFGVHDFDYYTIMTNLDRQMYSTQNIIQTQTVDYFPQYESYSYPLLKDEKEYAFDDRQAVALHYIGSVENNTIYPERRSKVNGFYNIGVMYDMWNPNYLVQNFTFSKGITISENT